jgi:outer membrane receptor protein involved in Fe transport
MNLLRFTLPAAALGAAWPALLLSSLPAQVAPAASPTAVAQSQPTGAVVELSPFTVQTDRDLGYQAENTLAGSRLNTQLRDTAGSISVFTQEFLDDTAITDLSELLRYTVNAEMNTNENQSVSEQNPVVNAQSLTPSILNRGLTASLGLDYFTSIMPTDPYRAGRIEDSRGPNSILFGVGAPGGLINQSSRIAAFTRDTGQLRYSHGSWARNRSELHANKVLIKDKVAVSIAALDQENGGWRDWEFNDKERIFASVTVRPHRRLTLTAMGEIGRDINAVIRSTVDSDAALAWYDNREARGVTAVTFTPNNTLPTAAMQALGVTTREVAATGLNRRAIFIENDGTVFDARGTFLTGSYNNAAVRAPDGTPGVTTGGLRVNDERIFPRHINAAGPGMAREQSLRNLTLTADWQVTRDFALNVAHNYQRTTAKVTLMVGADPTLRGDANRTLGVNGPVNPYAGRLYFDGNWREDVHVGEVTETRLSASYALDTKSKWFGRHRVAGMVSTQEQFDARANSWLAFAGRPYNNTPNNPNNRITVRNYLTEGNYGTYRVGDYRQLPKTIRFDGQEYGLVFANEVAGANNGGGEQESTSVLGVIQSHFLENQLVTTVGYRQDQVDVIELGYYNDPIKGDIVDRDRSKSQTTSATGYTGTAGLVYHVRPWVSLVANYSTNQGVPSFVRKTFPTGSLAPPSKGTGSDYGLSFDLLNGRVNAKVVYFTSVEKGKITTTGFGGASGRNTRVSDALESALVGPGRPYSAANWAPIEAALNPPATAASSDYESDGYEARVTANLTRNWRLVANYSYTDTLRTKVADEIAAWYGMKRDGNRLVQGVRQDASGRFVVDPGAYDANGTIAKWLELAAKHPEANVGTLTASNGLTVAEEIFNAVDGLNDAKEENEQRWGVRPHKISLYSAYDFKEGRLRGITTGGGWRWRSKNIIGRTSSGGERLGKALVATDLMVGYTMKIPRVPGSFRFQINVYNVLDETDIIPVRVASSEANPDGFQVPGGRGLGYSRYDLVTPREWRFTTTWSF